jgi:hypothetical protein
MRRNTTTSAGVRAPLGFRAFRKPLNPNRIAERCKFEGFPAVSVSNPTTFGRITSSLDPREMQMALKFYF